MSSIRLVLTPVYPLGTLTLQSDDDTCARVEIDAPTDELVLALTPIVGGGSSVSGPDIYAFAANYG